jgi:hypothetical protein
VENYGYIISYNFMRGVYEVVPIACDEMLNYYARCAYAIYPTQAEAETEIRRRIERVCPNYYSSLKK